MEEPTTEQMTVQDAMIHLHNLAHMFQSPLVLVEALKVVEDKAASYKQLSEDVDTLEKMKTELHKECQSLADFKKQLTDDVATLESRQRQLRSQINTMVAEFTAQAKA